MNLQIAGWGIENKINKSLSSKKSELNLDIIDLEKCEKEELPVNDKTLCTRHIDNGKFTQ